MGTLNMDDVVCHLCAGSLALIEGYSSAQQVTSDCRPWHGQSLLAGCLVCGTVQKTVTARWHEEAARIYRDYAVYAQGGGLEQQSFDATSGASRARSLRIIEWLEGQTSLPASGSLLDIGCGNGAFLATFGSRHPMWSMFGTELDDRNRVQVESIPGVAELHVGPLESLQARFDLIVMVHALEHIPEPAGFLQDLHALLKPGGMLLIQVPDLASSPFDILIADHCTHFSACSLDQLLELAGWKSNALSSGCVSKELTWLGMPGGGPRATQTDMAQRMADTRIAADHVRWLGSTLEQASQLSGPLGIFGSSISGTWLASALKSRATFFVDEDTDRIGQHHLGLPILPVADAPLDASIMMPIRRDLAEAIATRLEETGARLLIPPI